MPRSAAILADRVRIYLKSLGHFGGKQRELREGEMFGGDARRAPPTLGAALLGTARSWRGTFPFTHLAREGRMTVTIGRRELLAALGGTAAWPLAARGVGGAS